MTRYGKTTRRDEETAARARRRRISACLGRGFLTAGVILCLSWQVSAHDIGAIEQELSHSEPYAQMVDGEAAGFRLQDPAGREYSLDDFRGKVVVLYFIYARCQDECPLHSRKIAEIQTQIARASLAKQIQFIAVATDTESPSLTAEAMRSHGEKFGLDHSNWLFLYGGPGRETAGMTLAQAYGLQFTPAGAGVQLHGVVTHLIDPGGRLRARYHGLDFDPLSLTVYAAALIHGDHDSAADPGKGAGGGFQMPYWAEVAGGIFGLVFLFAAGWLGLRELRGRRHES